MTKKRKPIAPKIAPDRAAVGLRPLWYPRARPALVPPLRDYGEHETPGGYPTGAVVHYTADGPGVEGTLTSLARDGYGYHFLIDRAGELFQTMPITRRLAHAGKSAWGSHHPAHEFCGVALDLWGALKERAGRFYAWPAGWTREVAAELVRWGPSFRSPQGDTPWEGATKEQIAALTDLCLWLKLQGVPMANVVGHDEISNRGKLDPGGSLPFTMADYRRFLEGARCGDDS